MARGRVRGRAGSRGRARGSGPGCSGARRSIAGCSGDVCVIPGLSLSEAYDLSMTNPSGRIEIITSIQRLCRLVRLVAFDPRNLTRNPTLSLQRIVGILQA
jgi:hypothetical protein